jgi:hypothetical protein
MRRVVMMRMAAMLALHYLAIRHDVRARRCIPVRMTVVSIEVLMPGMVVMFGTE